jgi:hypothetical protein
MITRSITGRLGNSDLLIQLPPRQHVVTNFPILSAGPTHRISTDARCLLYGFICLEGAAHLP